MDMVLLDQYGNLPHTTLLFPLQWDLGMDTPCHLNRTGCHLLQDIKVLKIKTEDRIDAITSSNPEILVRKFAEIVNC
jgi:hypothetical protein